MCFIKLGFDRWEGMIRKHATTGKTHFQWQTFLTSQKMESLFGNKNLYHMFLTKPQKINLNKNKTLLYLFTDKPSIVLKILINTF